MPWIKIPYDQAKIEIISLPDDPDASLEWLREVYKHIDCDFIEVANTLIPDLVLVVDDSAKLFDGWEERINPFATVLYGSPWDPICGHAILCRRSGPDLIPITQDDYRTFMALFRRFSLSL